MKFQTTEQIKQVASLLDLTGNMRIIPNSLKLELRDGQPILTVQELDVYNEPGPTAEYTYSEDILEFKRTVVNWNPNG